MAQLTFRCPYCGTNITWMSEDSAFMAWRSCQKCEGEILIVDHVPMKPEDCKRKR